MSEEYTDILMHTYNTYMDCDKSIRKTAKVLEVSRRTIGRRLTRVSEDFKLDLDKPIVSGDVSGFKTIKRNLPNKNSIKRYIITTAQSNTHIHKPFWYNLKAYAEYIDAEILVSQFSYNKAAYGKKSVKPGKEPTKEDMSDLWFDTELADYFSNDRIELCSTLIYCGEMNILPTAVRPLSGFENYPGNGASAIFPHTTIALATIPSINTKDTKFNYTTGSVTVKNYIQKKAGLKAEFHHCYGALLVEINSKGQWWVRQINAVKDGSFYDLDVFVHASEVTVGNEIEAINWGDIHVEVLDNTIRKINWGENGILDTLRPKHQFMHDTIDFHARNHHRRSDPHALFERWVQDRADVHLEFERAVTFLNKESNRGWCKTIIIDSNHDNALERWLREADYKTDPRNAIFFLNCQLMKYTAIREGVEDYHMIENLLRKMGVDDEIVFLKQDESYIICGDIECGMHGHLGPNGSRGSPIGLSRLGRKANTGHTHTTQILNGLYVAGTSSKLRLDYNKGPSSWSQSHVITYKNGKRTVITIRDSKWRA